LNVIRYARTTTHTAIQSVLGMTHVTLWPIATTRANVVMVIRAIAAGATHATVAGAILASAGGGRPVSAAMGNRANAMRTVIRSALATFQKRQVAGTMRSTSTTFST